MTRRFIDNSELPDLHLHEDASGVFRCNNWGTGISQATVKWLIDVARDQSHGKARICFHPSDDALHHSMLIALTRDADEIIHAHPDKVETVVPIYGAAIHETYTPSGDLFETLVLSKEQCLYLSVQPGVWHRTQVVTDVFVFLESSTGPFTRDSTVKAPASWCAN